MQNSLRDIEVCLAARRSVLYHSGIRGEVKRCNLAYANEHRDQQVFAEVAAVLMRRARRLYADQSLWVRNQPRTAGWCRNARFSMTR